MKKNSLKIFYSALALSLTISTLSFINVYAFENNDSNMLLKSATEINDNAFEEKKDSSFIRTNDIRAEQNYELKVINQKLDDSNTTVKEQLQKFLAEDLDDFSKEDADAIRNGITEYLSKKDEILPKDEISPKADLPDHPYDINNTDMDIALSALAYLKLVNYKLSAHLLSRGLYAKSSSTYTVPNGIKDFLYNTEAYRGLCNGRKYKVGRTYPAKFANTYNRDEADAYYAIRRFRAEITRNKKGNRINIRDRYDFHEGSDKGIVGIAINAINRLEKRGSFTSYPIVIPLVRKVF